MLELLGMFVGIAALIYLMNAMLSWWEYGRRVGREGLDHYNDQLLPDWEVGEHHEIAVKAPASTAYAAARMLDIEESALVRLIFWLRQVIMRAPRAPDDRRRPFIERAQALGWAVLVDIPGRRTVLAAVTRPWQRAVTFIPLCGVDFLAFNQPGYAKIIWAIEVHPDGDARSIATTETRVQLTDPASRRRFRLYWALLSPGILAIRYLSLRLIRRQAENWTSLTGPGSAISRSVY
jgi:hypothetical protein